MPNTSIVHFGPGAFHRAHQAAYTHDLIEKTGGDYGICAVSLRSVSVRNALASQSFEYTLVILDHHINFKRVSSIKEMLVGPEFPWRVIDKLAEEPVTTVTLTITEKGYTLAGNGELDLSHPDIKHDLSNLREPISAVGYLVAGLRKRQGLNLSGLTIISCDNLPKNGQKLADAVIKFANLIDPNLAIWISDTCFFPSTMIDCITPATDEDLISRVKTDIGIDDAWPIQREAFTQWVIEDIEGASIPPWDLVGATFSNNVEGFEAAKLRVLNGMHSTLTFAGLLLGLETVRDAATHSEIRPYIAAMCYNEILPSLPPINGLAPDDYATSILRRFENPAIKHYLSQIFWDSSKKLPFRILETIKDNIENGRPIKGLCLSVAAWMATAKLYAQDGREMTDPLSERLLTMESATVQGYLNLETVFPQDLVSQAQFTDQVSQYFSLIENQPGGLIDAMIKASVH